MGIRFDLTTANWLAYLIQPNAPIPRMESPWMEKEALHRFLQKLSARFYSSRQREIEFGGIVERARRLLEKFEHHESGAIPRFILDELRRDLGNRPWTALIVPSGDDWTLDRFLTSEDLLIRLVGLDSDEPGLILQLEGDDGNEVFALNDVFPAFKTALAESTRWPGVLVWTRSGESVFLSFPSKSPPVIEECAQWIAKRLGEGLGVNLELLVDEYRRAFSLSRERKTVSIIHLSDIHLGCKEASRRLPRVQQLIRNVLDELGDGNTLLPVVSGDLMDSPNEDYLDRVRSFMDFIRNLGTEEPIVVLGNHDVREDGYMSEVLKPALQLPTSRVVWLDSHSMGIVCFNSVTGGKLARGLIGEAQFVDVGNEIDRGRRKNYSLVGVLHHHPTPVERPGWYLQKFYERVLGRGFEKTEELEDAQTFLNFAEGRSMAAILHGHKHIPRVATSPKGRIPIYGCGSTVGKVPTKDGSTYMSINVITIDNETGKLAGRLLAERIPGAGLVEETRHEVVHRASLNVAVGD